MSTSGTAESPATPHEAQPVPHGEFAVSNAGAKTPAGPDDAGGPAPHDSHAVTNASGSSEAEGHASTNGPAVQTAPGRPAQADAQQQAPPESTPGVGTPGAEETSPPSAAAVLETKAEWAPPAVPTGGDALQAIVQGWPAVLQAVRAESKNVEALLRSCSATAMDGATVTLACDGEFHARELQKPENKRMVEAGISHVAGQPCYVNCVVRDKKPEVAKPAPSGQPDAAKPDDDDPLVRAALRMLNARVLENN